MHPLSSPPVSGMRMMRVLAILAASSASSVYAAVCPFASGVAPFASLSTSASYAQNFAVSVADSGYTLKLSVGSQNVVLAACNSPSPPSGSISVPVQSLSIQQNAVLGYIERLGQRSSISSIGSDFATTPCALGITSSSTNASVTFGPTGVDVASAILSESSPLAMAEWIRFFDAFYGYQSNSTSIFNSIVSTYQCLTSKVSAFKNENSRPLAVISSSNLTSNSVIAPAHSAFWLAILSDAGIVPQIASSVSEFQSLTHSANLVFDLTDSGSTEYSLTLWESIYGVNSLTDGYPFLDGFKSQIWRFDKRSAHGINDFFNSFPAQPDLLLGDIISILDSSFFSKTPVDGSVEYWARDLAYSASYTEVSSSDCSSSTIGLSCPSSASFSPDIATFSTSSSSSSSSSSGVSAGSIVGGVVGGLAAAILLFLGLAWCVGRKRVQSGVDSQARGPFAWVKDVSTGRKFVALDDQTMEFGVVDAIGGKPRVNTAASAITGV
ncbi:hypothetical protein HDU84_003552 [Entophlyctis sp. JEL0112]|nr:hypothetical protein HDU84_003552 [Entophlyctis sp. JEL0112]